MAYARYDKDGAYIWSDGHYLNFNLDKIDENLINIFLAKLSNTDELDDRIKKGNKLILQYRSENNIQVGDNIE